MKIVDVHISECPPDMIDVKTRCKTIWGTGPVPSPLLDWYNTKGNFYGYSCKDDGPALNRCWTYPKVAETWQEAYTKCLEQGRSLLTRPSVLDNTHEHTAIRLYGGMTDWSKSKPALVLG